MGFNDTATWAAVRVMSRFNRRVGAWRLAQTEVDVDGIIARWSARGTGAAAARRIGRLPRH